MPVSLWLWFVNRNKSFINRILFFQSGIGFTYNETHVIPEEFADAAVPDIAVPFFAGCCRSGQCGNSITDELSRPLGRAVVYQLDLQQQLDAEQSILTFGIGGASVWMLLDIDNPTGLTQFRHLLLDTPWIDEVHFHVFREGVEVERWITGDNYPLLYAFYLGAFTIANFSYTGHGFAWLWPESVEWQRWAQPLLMIAFGSTGLVFATAFLDIRRHWRLAYRLSQGSVALVMLLYVLSLILGSQSLALLVAFAFMLVFTLLMLMMGIYQCSLLSGGSQFWSAGYFADHPFYLGCFAEFGMAVPLCRSGYAGGSHSAGTGAGFTHTSRSAKTVSGGAGCQYGLTDRLEQSSSTLSAGRGILASVSRHQLPLSVVVLDIDHFKNFNDTYGHAFGNEVLKKLAQCMRSNVREQDLAARWGGEEFILLMPDTGVQQAVAFAERLLQVLRNTPMVYQGMAVQVTASFGVAQLYPQDNNLDDLIQRADQALYRAKHEGRNRVCRHDPLLFTQPVRF